MLKSRNMDDVVYRRAAARVDAQLAFYRHVIIYVVANLLLAVLNLVRNRHHLWFHWVIFGWGIGLLAHGLNVYAYRWFASRREQMIQRESERQQRLRESPPP
ncbi:MAG TPA: histidine kinase [Spartobacteria bacterium]|jgi:2TM domain|nr:histidine kinase [Spartobacteria bacterium]HCP92169.1 histidine kinase [Spartobacteria bacterium]